MEKKNDFRPRICEVLGVEVGERFEVKGQPGPLYVDPDGYLKYDEDDRLSMSAIHIAINHPDRIIRKPKQEQEEKKVEKPSKDWTLGEVKAYCTGRDCYKDCELAQSPGKCKILDVTPSEWNLDEKPRFTEQEVEDAKTLKRIFGKNGALKRYDEATTKPYSTLVFNQIYINQDLFPSIREGQSYTLDEIIGGADHA